MLLVLDVGNTNVVGGLYDGAQIVARWRVSADRDRTADELHVLWDGLLRAKGRSLADLRGACVASVVPPLTATYRQLLQESLGLPAVMLGPGADLGIVVDSERPSEVGPDRIANTLAAREKYGAPAIVVDFGTATNFDVLSRQGSYIGGAIAPGMAASMDALVSRTSLLFRVPLTRPERAIGRSTVTCLQSGAFFGYVGLVEGIVDRMQDELGGGATVIATGGLASVIAPETKRIHYLDPDLTLDGIRGVWERNQPQAADPARKQGT